MQSRVEHEEVHRHRLGAVQIEVEGRPVEVEVAAAAEPAVLPVVQRVVARTERITADVGRIVEPAERRPLIVGRPVHRHERDALAAVEGDDRVHIVVDVAFHEPRDEMVKVRGWRDPARVDLAGVHVTVRRSAPSERHVHQKRRASVQGRRRLERQGRSRRQRVARPHIDREGGDSSGERGGAERDLEVLVLGDPRTRRAVRVELAHEQHDVHPALGHRVVVAAVAVDVEVGARHRDRCRAAPGQRVHFLAHGRDPVHRVDLRVEVVRRPLLVVAVEHPVAVHPDAITDIRPRPGRKVVRLPLVLDQPVLVLDVRVGHQELRRRIGTHVEGLIVGVVIDEQVVGRVIALLLDHARLRLHRMRWIDPRNTHPVDELIRDKTKSDPRQPSEHRGELIRERARIDLTRRTRTRKARVSRSRPRDTEPAHHQDRKHNKDTQRAAGSLPTHTTPTHPAPPADQPFSELLIHHALSPATAICLRVGTTFGCRPVTAAKHHVRKHRYLPPSSEPCSTIRGAVRSGQGPAYPSSPRRYPSSNANAKRPRRNDARRRGGGLVGSTSEFGTLS